MAYKSFELEHIANIAIPIKWANIFIFIVLFLFLYTKYHTYRRPNKFTQSHPISNVLQCLAWLTEFSVYKNLFYFQNTHSIRSQKFGSLITCKRLQDLRYVYIIHHRQIFSGGVSDQNENQVGRK